MSYLRLAARQIVRYPGFNVVVIATLALGIGACTLIFSAVNGVLLKPLPYPEPERIVRVRQIGGNGNAFDNISEPNFSDLQGPARSFAALARYAVGAQPVSGGSEPARVSTAMVSGEFFDVVGIQPLAGRTFLPGERDVGAAPVAVISHAYWQRFFAGDPAFGDRTLRIADRTYSIVGVMPAGFDYPDGADIWTPAELWPLGESRTAHNWRAVGRLADGVSLEQARAELSTIARGVKAEHGDGTWMFDAAVDPLHDVMVRTARPALLVLFAAGGLLFAIAVANAANLVLARAITREQELGVRAALGAGRWRLASQFFAEMLLVCAGGGALGLLFAAWGIEALVQLADGRLPRADAVGIDSAVLGFTIALTVATAAGLSLMAAWRAGSRVVLRYNQRMSSGAPESPLAGGLVVTQIALALLLVAGAVLLARSFLTLTSVDPGFRTEGLVFMDVSPPLTDDLTDLEPLVPLYSDLIARLRALPGVEAIAGISLHPGSGGGWDATAHTQDTPNQVRSFDDLRALTSDPMRPEVRGTEYRLASEDYFATVGIPLLRGRVFERSDGEDSERVAVVSPSLAERLWPGEDPIGKLVQISMDSDLRPSTVVGIVGDVRGDYGIEQEPRPTFYAPFRQHPGSLRIFEIVMRTRDAAGVVPAAREIVQRMNAGIVPQFSTSEQNYAAQLAPRRLNLVLIGVFGGTALLLALAGIYGSIAFHIARRSHEIGVRMALGARPNRVVSMVLRRSLLLAGIGVAAGIALALAASRLASSLLFGIAPYDPVSYVLAAAVLLFAAAAAAWVPALRAARVDPVTALRSE
jgi:putative ABC transport system permease protein